MYSEDCRNELIDYYSRIFAKQDLKFTMMGMLLDTKLVAKRLKEFGMDRFFIFGTGPLGIQALRATEKHATIPGFIDEVGEYYDNYNYSWGYKHMELPVYKPEEMKEIYNGEKILLASFEDLIEMMDACRNFAADKDVIMINEFLFGGAKSDLYK